MGRWRVWKIRRFWIRSCSATRSSGRSDRIAQLGVVIFEFNSLRAKGDAREFTQKLDSVSCRAPWRMALRGGDSEFGIVSPYFYQVFVARDVAHALCVPRRHSWRRLFADRVLREATVSRRVSTRHAKCVRHVVPQRCEKCGLALERFQYRTARQQGNPRPQFPRARNREKESGACPEFRLQPEFAPLVFNDLPADCQTEAGAGNIPICQALERHEHAGMVLRRDTDAIVPDSA